MTDETTQAGSSRLPRLLVQVGGQVIREIPLGAEFTIGRGADNDLTLNDPRISRHHARVYLQDETYFLVDLGSANGTRLGGVRLTAPHNLQSGEKFTIGNAELTFEQPADLAPETVTVPVAVVPAVAALSPSPELELVPESSADRPSRGLIIGFAIVTSVLVLAVAVFIVYQLVANQSEPVALTEEPTPVASEVAATATPEAGTLVMSSTATEPPASLVSPLPAGEFDTFLIQANTLTRRSKFEEAVAIYEELVEREPGDAQPEAGWANALLYDNEPEQAIEHAERAVELDPDSAEAATVLSRAYAQTGDASQALEHAETAVRLDPDSAEAHAALAQAYLLNGEDQLAGNEADLALELDANNANARRVRGWIDHIVDGSSARAVGELQYAAGLEPELWLRRHELGLLLLEIKNHSSSIAALQEALAIRPEAATYNALGQAFYETREYGQAEGSLRKALSAGAEDADTYALLAASYARLDRCNDALVYSELALAWDSASVSALDAREICTGARPTPVPGTPPAAASTTPGTSARATREPAGPAAISGQIGFPAWNPQTSTYDTYVSNTDGSARRLVATEMHQPATSPDGGWLALNGEREAHRNLCVARPDGSGLTEITTHVEDGQPNWSADGKRLVFASTRHGDKKYRVYIIDEIPFAGGKVEGRSLNYGPDDVRGQMPAWAADGRIVYRGCAPHSAKNECEGFGLFIISSDPGPQPTMQLTEHPEDTAPAVYGNQIAFMSNRDGNWEIYSVRNDASDLRRLTISGSMDGLPTWSPDGKTIAFVSNRDGAWAVWAMNPDGTSQRKLFDIGGGGLASDWEHERISWGP